MNHSISCDHCGVEFEKNTHNQKYCSAECCRLATNKRIMERYYEKKGNRGGRQRTCRKRGCDTKLSRYNDNYYCSVHGTSGAATGKELLGLVGMQ